MPVGSTNFLQHNPTAANQENDGTYLAESIRTGGIGVDQILPSDWLNKVWYQSSTFVAAFCQMMANKGFVMSDSNISTLTNVLANVFTSADQKANLQSVAYSPTTTYNAGASNGFETSLTGNLSAAVVGATPGQIITFIFGQDNVGGRTVTLAGMLSGQTLQGLNPAPNTWSVVSVIVGAGGNLVNFAQEVIFIPPVQNGTGVGQTGNTNQAKIGWSGTRLKATVDTTDLGNIVFDTQLNPVSTVASNAAAAIAAFQALFVGTLSGNGFVKIPIGGVTLILQWGTAGDPNNGSISVTFPTAFPNACFVVNATDKFGGNHRIVSINSFSASSFVVSNDGSSGGVLWFAIGH